jgi:LysM repeat protein
MGVALHLVKRGETLNGIAKKNGTTLAVLLKLNNRKIDDPLLWGLKIKVPAAGAGEEAIEPRKAARDREKAPKRRFLTHRVKRGESLGSIARDRQISLQALLEANDMKRDDLLFAGRLLKIPADGTDPMMLCQTKNQRKVGGQARTNDLLPRKEGRQPDGDGRRHHTSVESLMALNPSSATIPFT